MVLLAAGELLVGAKQNRVLNASIMVAAQSELLVPVSCVERGRWGYRGRSFGSGGSTSHGRLRAAMSRQAAASYKMSGQPLCDQGKVWREVDMCLMSLCVHSRTASLHEAYVSHDAAIQKAMQDARVPEGCCGVLFAVDGRIAGADLFDKPATLAKLWPKLVKSYLIDAMQGGEPGKLVGREAVEIWLRAVPAARCERFKSPGLGDDVRLESEDWSGAGLVVSETPVHVELFASRPQ